MRAVPGDAGQTVVDVDARDQLLGAGDPVGEDHAVGLLRNDQVGALDSLLLVVGVVAEDDVHAHGVGDLVDAVGDRVGERDAGEAVGMADRPTLRGRADDRLVVARDGPDVVACHIGRLLAGRSGLLASRSGLSLSSRGLFLGGCGLCLSRFSLSLSGRCLSLSGRRILASRVSHGCRGIRCGLRVGESRFGSRYGFLAALGGCERKVGGSLGCVGGGGCRGCLGARRTGLGGRRVCGRARRTGLGAGRGSIGRAGRRRGPGALRLRHRRRGVRASGTGLGHRRVGRLLGGVVGSTGTRHQGERHTKCGNQPEIPTSRDHVPSLSHVRSPRRLRPNVRRSIVGNEIAVRIAVAPAIRRRATTAATHAEQSILE